MPILSKKGADIRQDVKGLNHGIHVFLLSTPAIWIRCQRKPVRTGSHTMPLTLQEIEELKRIKSRYSKIERKNSSQSADLYPLKKKAETPDSGTGHKSKKPGIVVNRMYVGAYLESNLGHEIINLFKADNGEHYLYLNSSGSLAREHCDIDYMLMVKYAGNNTLEVIGLAKGLEIAPGADSPRPRDIKQLDDTIAGEQRDFILSQPGGGIKYGGVSILDIFKNAEQQSVFITYKANEVLVPKDEFRIFLKYQKDACNSFGEKEIIIALRQHNLPKTSLKSYIYPSKDNSASSDYDNIVSHLIHNERFWTSDRDWKIHQGSAIKEKEVSLFDICQIQDDENRFSNALAYFMTRLEYRDLWIDFFKKFGVELNKDYQVEREASARINDSENRNNLPNGGRIDLLISDDKNLVVVENKIKSDVNTVEQDSKVGTTQLNRYENYINWRISKEDTGRKGIFLILCPDYNRPELRDNEKVYNIITYSDLYKYLSDKPQIEIDNNFKAFRDAMQRHTYLTPNGYLYNDMLDRFERRISEIQS